MRALVDIVQNLTSSIRWIIGIVVLASLLFGLILTAGVAYVAPKAAEVVAERAQEVGEQAILAAQKERVADQMADDGWGYNAAAASATQDLDEKKRAMPKKDGWGE